MKHLILILFFMVSNQIECAFLKKTLSFTRDEKESKISEQKTQIKILNEPRKITIGLFAPEEKIRRYIHPNDLERIFWQLSLTSTNPSGCLQVLCETDNQSEPKISTNLCYPCYTWKLQPLCIGKAILEVEQFKKNESILKQWLNVTITE